jgi:hypothetical protein
LPNFVTQQGVAIAGGILGVEMLYICHASRAGFGAIAEKNRRHFLSETKPVMRSAAIQCPAKKRIALVLAFHFRSPSKAHPDSHAAKLDLATR